MIGCPCTSCRLQLLHRYREERLNIQDVDQEKNCAVCHSSDGINWTDHRLVLGPRREVANEDIAVAAPFVWREGQVYRMLYCGNGYGSTEIGTAIATNGNTENAL